MSQYSGTDVLSVAPSSSGTYSESEINSLIARKADIIHFHDEYSELSHTHRFLDLSDSPNSYAGQGTKVIAVRADGSGLEFVYSGGAGSVRYENEIDQPPNISNPLDDEFLMSSLDTKWLWVNQGAASVQLDGRSLKISSPKSGVICRGIVQNRPVSNDFTVTTKFLGCNYWGNYAKTGILISESLTGKQLGIWHAYDGGWKGLMGEFFSSPTARTSYNYYGFPV